MSERKEIIDTEKQKNETSLINGSKSIKLLFFVSMVIVCALVDLVVNNSKEIAIYAMLGILILLDLFLLIHLKNIALKQNFLRIENENISDQMERTKFGILKLVTGEKI
jgi:DMSO/TMAO reductase YedYZ heme-binding membrane subunit